MDPAVENYVEDPAGDVAGVNYEDAVADIQDTANMTDMADMQDTADLDDMANMDEAIGNSGDHKQERDDNVVAGSGEKRWPGWPGESVFRILVPSQKVGGIIGRKGESIKRMCEESRARIKILDGPQGAPERAVLSADLDNIQISVVNQNRRTGSSLQRPVF